MKFCDDQSHLQTPVSQMYITNHIVSHEFTDALYTLSDDSRTQVSYMKRLGHIGSAVIHDNRLWIFCCLTPKASLILFHFRNYACKVLLAQL